MANVSTDFQIDKQTIKRKDVVVSHPHPPHPLLNMYLSFCHRVQMERLEIERRYYETVDRRPSKVHDNQ